MKKLKYIRFLLFPIALLYGAIVRVRNLLFNIGFLNSESFSIPVISVGNITVGGTGKTPLTEFIIKTLKDDYSVALLSRGYKRETKGVIVAGSDSEVREIGDEPKQILDKFKDIIVAVAEKRVDGIKRLLSKDIKPQVIVMDDAYQHRYVKPGYSILVIDYNRPLWKDLMLPAGELREPMSGKRRANIILFSKCPANLSIVEQKKLIKKVKLSSHQEVYFSNVGYQDVSSVFSINEKLNTEQLKKTTVLIVTGIANPQPLVDYLKPLVKEFALMQFPDHHQFTYKEIKEINHRFDSIQDKSKVILTTEKDAVRFKQVISEGSELAKYLYFIPIEIKILNDKKEEFKEKIITYVKENKGDR